MSKLYLYLFHFVQLLLSVRKWGRLKPRVNASITWNFFVFACRGKIPKFVSLPNTYRMYLSAYKLIWKTGKHNLKCGSGISKNCCPLFRLQLIFHHKNVAKDRSFLYFQISSTQMPVKNKADHYGYTSICIRCLQETEQAIKMCRYKSTKQTLWFIILFSFESKSLLPCGSKQCTQTVVVKKRAEVKIFWLIKRGSQCKSSLRNRVLTQES